MTDKKPEIHINVRFPPEVIAALRPIAQEHLRSLNGEIVWAIREYIARHQREQREEEKG